MTIQVYKGTALLIPTEAFRLGQSTPQPSSQALTILSIFKEREDVDLENT